MTDPTTHSGDLLTWLDTAIRRRENTARAVGWASIRSSDYGPGTKYLTLRRPGQSTNTPALEANLADHIALHDPASVLRRCAADRKLLESLKSVIEGDYIDDGEPVLAEHVLSILAEGYGWTADA